MLEIRTLLDKIKKRFTNKPAEQVAPIPQQNERKSKNLKDFYFKAPKDKDYWPSMHFQLDGNFAFVGASYMENAQEFYEPVLEWVENFMKSKKDVTLSLQLYYCNTSSIKQIDQLLRRLQEYAQSGRNVQVLWYYNEEDEDSISEGEDFKDLITLPFSFISYKPGKAPLVIE